MKKEILPELYNYNKFPGPQFIIFDDIVKTDDLTLKLVENYKDGFQLEVFNQRFSDILLKYDYIVGDWGNDQLRLKGFYKDHRARKSADKLSRLEDYLKEYCNYGCAYFVLANEEPKDQKSFEKPYHRRKRKQKPRFNPKPNHEGREKREGQRNKEAHRLIQEAKREFIIRQKNR
ncbi:YutD family protein [Streptococcus cuniculipharyngis]|uniref:DUF1027 domain-containing protein n=1 Tax=Streptococcus cuniculipharyngis TaxID=1562651 RepID=A0A5C5SH28_9STRE|nr:YutD-like domain-containing protein [Streptococcus cuniculipharyngis]TWS99221.1 DUF1027 domain-containing protein [Streptococcus cuniculipharyngis]